jgi:hypothetical protein
MYLVDLGVDKGNVDVYDIHILSVLHSLTLLDNYFHMLTDWIKLLDTI